MRTLLRLCSLSLILVCGAALAEPEEEPGNPTPLAGTPESDAEALARLQKMKIPSAQAATPKSIKPSVQAPKSVEPNTPELIRKRGADWLAQCLKDWDAETHMTKKDWQRVCRRLAGEHINELIKQAKK
jgi:hypothetical protein